MRSRQSSGRAVVRVWICPGVSPRCTGISAWISKGQRCAGAGRRYRDADVTGVFLREMISLVDVRDFGAVGDGVTDDSAAFEAADQAAGGRRVYVPQGTYHLGENTSMASEMDFEGTVTMPDDKMLLLTKSFDLASLYFGLW